MKDLPSTPTPPTSMRRNGPRIDLEALERDHRAATLPDHLFDDHPAVKALRADVAVRERRCGHLSAIGAASRLDARAAELRAELERLRAERIDAAIDAAFDGSPRFVELHARIAQAELTLEAVTLARAAIPNPGAMTCRQYDLLHRAKSDLGALMKNLKREYLDREEGRL